MSFCHSSDIRNLFLMKSVDEMAKQKMNNEHRLGHSLGKKKTIWFFLWFFIFQTYRKYGSILLGHFIKHKYLIVEECCTMYIA